MILERLLAPMGLETFFAEYHDTRPFHLKGVGDFREWMSYDALDRLIATGGLRSPAFRMAKNSNVVPMGQIALDSVPWGGAAVREFAMPDQVFALLAQGTSLVLDDADLVWPPLAEAARALQLELASNVTTHVFCTPAGQQAFNPHYDIHNVFLVQVEGSKYWRIHEPEVERPLRTQKDSSGCEPGELLFEGLVSAGDVLYIPRGTVHYGQTRDQASLHASLSTTPFTWHEVVRNALKNFDDALLDEPVPFDVRSDVELPDDLDEAFDDMLERFADKASAAAAFDRLAEVWVKRRTALGTRLADVGVDLGGGTRVRRRAQIVHRRSGNDVLFERSRVEVPPEHMDLVCSAAAYDAGRIGVELTRTLLNSGYLEVVR